MFTLETWQAYIDERYGATDLARGPSKTFLWFMEEVGELAEALARLERGEEVESLLSEEFADVLAWLTTLANITGVDLNKAVTDKYIEDGGPQGVK
ncbi:MAG: MazG nucleotide pyrophosphohydrolase domain-containing protein [Phycisphaerales bacterium]|nr:MazG nucleotide pyrophosphohydrolase domain-containing protein [Phycisphaerales bacterium]